MEFQGLVSAVGVLCASAERQYLVLCSQTRKQCIQFFVTRLDEQSAPLLSPFFEHSVSLTEAPNQAEEECEWAPVYLLHEWYSQQFRVPALVTDEKEYAKRARDIVRHSFYPLMVRATPHIIQAWQRRCMDWRCFHRCLATTLCEDFSWQEWLTREATPAQFWAAYTQRYAGTLTEAIKSLRLDVKSAVAHNMQHLAEQLDNWHQWAHIGGYLRYRLDAMPLVHRVAQRGLLAVPHAHLSTERLRDLDTLYTFLESDPLEEEEEEEEASVYADFGALFGQTIRPSATQTVLDHFDGGRSGLRRRLLDDVVARKLVTELDRLAVRSPSTYYPVSVKTILYHYRRLFGLDSSGCEPALETVTLDEEWRVADEDAGKFDAEAAALVVQHFYQFVGRPTCPWSKFAYRRLVPAWSGTVTLKVTDSLCYVAAKTSLNRHEEAIRGLLRDSLRCVTEVEAATAAHWDPVEARRQFDALDDIDLGLYDVRVNALLFTPVEMAVERADLRALHGLLTESVFTCTVVRAPSADYSLRRVEAHFSDASRGGASLADLRACFCESDAAVARETLAVVDAHLFSLEAMHGLLRWLAAARTGPQPVRRLVMLGASDMLPLQADGQAWYDALAWLGYEPPTLFRHVQLNASLDELLHSHIERRLLQQCYFDPASSAVQDFVVKQLAGLTTRPDVLRLCCLVPQPTPSPTRPKPDALLTLVEAGVTAKFRANNNVRVEAVHLAQLTSLPMTRHQANTGYYFFIAQRYAQQLSRNELNHLLVELMDAPLIVVCEQRPAAASFKWLLESDRAHHKYPNTRYTLRYLSKILDTV